MKKMIIVISLGVIIFFVLQPSYKAVSVPKEVNTELLQTTTKLVNMVFFQPKALGMSLELMRETLSGYEPKEQHGLVLKYIKAIKDLRIENQTWLDTYKVQIASLKDQKGTEDEEILMQLRKLSKAEDVLKFVEKNKIPDLLPTLKKAYAERLKISDILARYDNEFETELDLILKKISTKSTVWERITNNIQSFFYKGLPPVQMDQEMLDAQNNDL